MMVSKVSYGHMAITIVGDDECQRIQVLKYTN